MFRSFFVWEPKHRPSHCNKRALASLFHNAHESHEIHHRPSFAPCSCNHVDVSLRAYCSRQTGAVPGGGKPTRKQFVRRCEILPKPGRLCCVGSESVAFFFCAFALHTSVQRGSRLDPRLASRCRASARCSAGLPVGTSQRCCCTHTPARPAKQHGRLDGCDVERESRGRRPARVSNDACWPC